MKIKSTYSNTLYGGMSKAIDIIKFFKCSTSNQELIETFDYIIKELTLFRGGSTSAKSDFEAGIETGQRNVYAAMNKKRKAKLGKS